MKDDIEEIRLKFCQKIGLKLTNLIEEDEGKEYKALRFKLNNFNIVYRNAKITPKKSGLFVTFWKRNQNNITIPFDENDDIDFYIINIKKENFSGMFIMPKNILIEKGIISTNKKEGKKGFRVYPNCDVESNKQAKNTQAW